MKINQHGIAIVKTFEGLVDGDPDTPGLDPYPDPIGIPTIGWGSIWDLSGARVTMATPAISMDEAVFLLRRELRRTEHEVAALIRAPVNENQFSALVSLVYNIGSGNFKASTLRQKLNRGDYEGASLEFPKWRRAGGKILRGLVRRRLAEQQLFTASD